LASFDFAKAKVAKHQGSTRQLLRLGTAAPESRGRGREGSATDAAARVTCREAQLHRGRCARFKAMEAMSLKQKIVEKCCEYVVYVYIYMYIYIYLHRFR